MMNKFEEAVIKGELLKFALGKEGYFVADLDYGEHSVIQSWINSILPLITLKGKEYVDAAIEQMFKELIQANFLDDQTRNENLLYHLHVYYYLGSEGRLNVLPMDNLNAIMEESLSKYVSFLENTGDQKALAVNNAIALIKKRGGLLNLET